MASNSGRCGKVYGLLGLAAKMGALASGWGACESALAKVSAKGAGPGRNGPGGDDPAKGAPGGFGPGIANAGGAGGLLILAGDSSEGTKGHFKRLASDGGVGCIIFGSSFELGRRIGKGNRSVLIVKDAGFSRRILDILGIVDGI